MKRKLLIFILILALLLTNLIAIPACFSNSDPITGGDTSGGDTSGGDTSGGDTSGGDTSGGDTSGGDTSGGDTSGGDTSGGDTSGGDTSEGDTSEGDTSEGDTSEGDTSEGCQDKDLSISYSQLGESLSVNLTFYINNYQSFDSATYSIARTTKISAVDENNEQVNLQYVDTAIDETEITAYNSPTKIEVPYHGNWTIQIKLYKNDELTDSYSDTINVKASHYNISYYNATMPLLLNTIRMFTEDWEGVYYMCFERTTTFNWNELPENVYPMPTSTISQATTNLGLFDEEGNEKTTQYGALSWGSWGEVIFDRYNALIIKQWVADLYAMDNTSTFTFSGIDSRIHNILIFAYGNNLPESNFEIDIYADGSGTANGIYYDNLNSLSSYNLKKENTLSWIEENVQSYQPYNTTVAYYFSYTLAEKENVNYYVHCKENMLASVSSEEVKEILDKNLTSLTVSDGLEEVKNSGKYEQFLNLLRLRWVDNTGETGTAQQYFENENGKPSLMVLGTAPTSEKDNGLTGDGNSTFLTLMQYVVDEYGDDYNILYKGHPAWPISSYTNGEQRKTWLERWGITVLPNATPAETYMYLYEDVYIGGYFSTTFASSQIGQTLFFFGSEESIKAQPSLAQFFDTSDPNYLGIFANTIFLTEGNALHF